MSSYTFKTQPWPHQLAAFEFALKKPACMLALSMGYGKSKIVVDLIANRDHQKVLIVCPKSVMQVWPKQFGLHDPMPNRSIEVLESGTCIAKGRRMAELLARAKTQARPIVCVVNYDAWWRDGLGDEILRHLWDCVVLDESHRIKAPGSRASWYAKSVHARYRLCLTGTPMPHSPLDVYGQFRFLDREIFGKNFTLFRARYARMGGFEGRQVVGFQHEDELNQKFYSIAFRAEADLGLPEAQHIEREFTLVPKAWKIYRTLERELIAEVDTGVVTAANALVKLLRLQQITSGFVAVDDTDRVEEIDTGKRALLSDILEDLDTGEPIVIFCKFRRDLDAIGAVATALGRSSGELSGRADNLAAWQAGAFPVLAVQIQSGGLGVDLTRARYCVYYSLGFSLGEYEQSVARVHRPGQTRPVFYIHLIAQSTVDQRVYAALKKKKDVVTYVLSDMQQKGACDGHRTPEAFHGAGAQTP